MNKKAVMILGLSAFILVAGITGFVVWRLYQDNQIKEPPSQAGGGFGACCAPIDQGGTGCAAGWKCVPGTECTFDTLYPRQGCVCNTNANGDQTCVCPGTCEPLNDGEPPIVTKYNCGATKCEYPEVAVEIESSDTDVACSCLPCGDPNSGCTVLPDKCTPAPCPTGKETCTKGTEGCEQLANSECVVYGHDCNNPSYVYQYCKDIPNTSVKCGETCTIDADCTDANNICENNICQLETNSCTGTETAGDTCFCETDTTVPCGQTCTDDTDCSDAHNICLSGKCQLDSLQCDTNETLSTNKCSCVTQEIVCGDACTTNSQCTDANNECKNGKCQLKATACPTGEVLSANACACQKVPPKTGIMDHGMTSLGAVLGMTLILVATGLIIDWKTSIKVENVQTDDNLRIIIENKNKPMKKKIISIRY